MQGSPVGCPAFLKTAHQLTVSSSLNQPNNLFMERYRIVIDFGVYILTFIVVEWLLFLPGMGGVSCEGRPDHQLAWMEQQAD